MHQIQLRVKVDSLLHIWISGIDLVCLSLGWVKEVGADPVEGVAAPVGMISYSWDPTIIAEAKKDPSWCTSLEEMEIFSKSFVINHNSRAQ